MRIISFLMALAVSLQLLAQPAAGEADNLYREGMACLEGDSVAPNPKRAFTLFSRAAEMGHPAAQYQLGDCYYNAFGTPQNIAEAVAWWKKAADGGDHDAMRSLAFQYELGSGVPRNPAKAVELYKASAGKGDALAANYLADMYESGRGVEQNLCEAFTWHRKAADLGNIDSKAKLGIYYCEGVCCNPKTYLGVRLLREAAKAGSIEAGNYLSARGIEY